MAAASTLKREGCRGARTGVSRECKNAPGRSAQRQRFGASGDWVPKWKSVFRMNLWCKAAPLPDACTTYSSVGNLTVCIPRTKFLKLLGPTSLPCPHIHQHFDRPVESLC